VRSGGMYGGLGEGRREGGEGRREGGGGWFVQGGKGGKGEGRYWIRGGDEMFIPSAASSPSMHAMVLTPAHDLRFSTLVNPSESTSEVFV